MSLVSLTPKSFHIESVLHDEAVEIPTRNTGEFGRRGNIATRLAEKSGDCVALEAGDGAALGFEEAFTTLQRGWCVLLEMQREQRHLDLAARREHHRPLDDIFQLTEVARPRIALEEIERLGGEAVHLLVDLGFRFAEKMMSEDGDVIDPFPQRRQHDSEGVEAIEEVRSKLAGGDGFLERAVGGGNDPHAHLAR